MSMVRRPSPFGELLSLRQAMDRLFEESYVRPRGYNGLEGGGTMPLDIYTTEDALVVEAALPGVKPEDVDITVTGDTLTINATQSEERRSENEGVVYQEIRRGSQSRTVALPNNLKADEANATFENGILRLRIPKAEEARPRQIRISPTTEASNARNVSAGASAEGNGNAGAGTDTGSGEGR